MAKEQMFNRKWKKVYERLPIERKDLSLTEISGFTNFCDNPQIFRQKVLDYLCSEFDLSQVRNICEIGCGCGDKLGHFYQLGHSCYGIDYAENMIKRAQKEMPKANLSVSQAHQTPFEDNSMDYVFAYSVFIYFESKEYFYQVLEEMYRIAKPNAKICIWDVPDIIDKEKVIEFRGKQEKGYEHTYYDMNDFMAWFKTKNTRRIKSEYMFIPEYKLSNHRFNITVQLCKKDKN